MAGIGDYVHARYWSYRKYGINKLNTFPSSTASAALNEAHSKLIQTYKSKANRVDTQEMQTYLNDMIYGNWDNIDAETSAWAAQFNKEQHENIMTTLLQQLQAKWPKLKVNIQNLSLSGRGATKLQQTLAELNITNKRTRNKNVQRSSLETLSSDLDKLTAELTAALRRVNRDSTSEERESIRDINKRLKFYKNTITNLLKTTQDQLFDLDVSRKLRGAKKEFTLRQMYEDLVQISKVDFAPSKTEIGDLGEIAMAYLLSLVAGHIELETNEEILQLIASAVATNKVPTGVNVPGRVVGTQRSPTYLQNFGDNVDLGLLTYLINTDEQERAEKAQQEAQQTIKTTKTYKYEGDDYIASVRGSQDTVDIIIQLQDNTFLKNATSNLTQLNASIKNVKSADLVHILGGAPLLSVLQLSDTDFVNHYLNILAFNDTYSTQLHEDYTEYSDEIKFIAAVRALTGTRRLVNNTTRFSDVFIVNVRNGRNKGVIVYETSELLQQIEKLSPTYPVLSFGDQPWGGRREELPWCLPNNWQGQTSNLSKATQRITYLIAQLHNYKLHLSLALSELRQ